MIEQQVEERFGDYILVEPLGRGGMGEVFKAYHQEDVERSYPYALKRLYTGDPELVTQALREAAIARALRSDYFVEAYDVNTVNTQPYILLEFVDGADLGRIIGRLQRRKRKMPLEVLLDLLEQIGLGLAEAHHHTPRGSQSPKPVIHRDLKPQNLLIRRDGHVKIADFGIAFRLGIDLEDSHERPGTLSYMAPEQVDPDANRPISPATDIFALGAIAYELCAVEALFQGSDQYILQQITDPDPLVGPRLKSIGSDLHPELRRIIAKCLRWDPKKRYADGREFADEIGALRRRLGFQRSVLKAYMLGFQDLQGLDAQSVLTAGRKGVAVALPMLRDRGPLTGRHAEVLEFSAKRRLPLKERRALRERSRKRRLREILGLIAMVLLLWFGSSSVLSASFANKLTFEAEEGVLVSISQTCNGVYHSLQPTPMDYHYYSRFRGSPLDVDFYSDRFPICAHFMRKGYLPLEMEITKEMADEGTIKVEMEREVCVEISTDPPNLPARVSHRWQPGMTGPQADPLRVCGLYPQVPYLVQVKYRGEIWDVERFEADAGDVVAVYGNFIPSVEEPKDPSVECKRRYDANRLQEALGYCQVAVAEGDGYLERLEAHIIQARIYIALERFDEGCQSFLFALDEAVRARDRRKESDLLFESRAVGCEVP